MPAIVVASDAPSVRRAIVAVLETPETDIWEVASGPETLAAVAESPFLDDRQKLETLFLATLSRPMRPEEASRYQRYVEQGGPTGNPRKALADVFWVLLNSSEFILNH